MRTIVMRAAWAAGGQATALMAAALLLAAAPTRAQVNPALVGTYDGGQMEMAAGLELGVNGRFRYALSYGALDEQAAGKWTTSGGNVLLTSDPINPPRFALVSQGRVSGGILRVDLDLPKGLSRQYFKAVITKASGVSEQQQLTDDGLMAPFARDDPPTSIRVVFPVFGVAGEPVRLDPNTGYSVRFRFEPNDLGKVDFRSTPLRIADGALLLDRHGRAIKFRRTAR